MIGDTFQKMYRIY